MNFVWQILLFGLMNQLQRASLRKVQVDENQVWLATFNLPFVNSAVVKFRNIIFSSLRQDRNQALAKDAVAVDAK